MGSGLLVLRPIDGPVALPDIWQPEMVADVTALVKLRAGIPVVLVVSQHGVDDPRQFVGSDGDALESSQLLLPSAQEGTQGTVEAVHAIGSQTQRGGAVGLVRELLTLMPVIRLLGLSANQDATCWGFLTWSCPS